MNDIEKMVARWFGEPVLAVEDELKQYIRQSNLELIEWVGKEVIGEREDVVKANSPRHAFARNDLRLEQRQTLEEKKRLMEEAK